MNAKHSLVFDRARTCLALAFSALLATAPVYGVTEISNSPLVVNVTAAPNVYFIFDNSGSMDYQALPDYFHDEWSFDDSVRTGSSSSKYMPDYDDLNILNIGMRSSQINRMYYNPVVTYRRWTGADGLQYAASSPTAAKLSPTSSSTIDLTASQSGTFRWRKNTASTFSTSLSRVRACPGDTDTCTLSFWPMTFYVYKGTGSEFDRVNYTRYQIQGNSASSLDLAVGGTETAVTGFSWAGGITRTIEEEQQNFANWYTYNRSRRDAAKTGVTAAFSTLGENYRIGYTPLNGTTGKLLIPLTGGFAGTNKESWFSGVLGASGTSSTPLRVGLAQAGEYFRTTTGANDPWGPEEPDGLLGCRQSFTILTTDGYYNDSSSSVTGVNASLTNVDGNIGEEYGGPPYADTQTTTLADVAMYYYANDLRGDISNKVPTTDEDTAPHQHMVTFAVAFGLQGSLDPASDLPRLASGELSWPSTSTDSGKMDDLWHATVNGRGKFVSAATPEEFAAGLKSALDTIVQRTASASNLGISSNELRAGSKVFQARFTSEIWTGDVWAYTVANDGTLPEIPTWKALDVLPEPASRNIYTRNGTLGVTFAWDSLSTDQKAALGNDSTVLDYLRGVRTQEVDQNGSFRNRIAVIGDIINSSPVYVAAPENHSYERFSWAGASSYQAFRSTAATRREMVYVTANDGMLHAFDADAGQELFAYVPSAALSAMHGLTSPSYSHIYITDGAVAVDEVFQGVEGGGGQWRSVLVSSQGRGGRQLFALDVSDPDAFAASKVLWEFTDSDFGKFTGKPVVTRMANGRWAVVVGNGYNSDQYNGFLFVIDAVTGALIRKIDTGTCPVGESPCISNGLADVTTWDDDSDGDADYAYAGDLRGNVWRFDLGSESESEWKVSFGTDSAPLPLFRAVDAAAAPQPITSRVAVLLNPDDGRRWISVGTGKFLANGDRGDTSVQTWYGMYDNYPSGTATSPVVGRSELAQRLVRFETDTYLEGTSDVNPDRVRVISAPGDDAGGALIVDAAGVYIKKGWYFDLVPDTGTAAGERMLYGVQAFGGALFATSAIPAEDPCTPGGSGWLMAIDPYTGGRLNANIFISRDPVSLTNPDGSTSNYYVSGVALGAMPSSPILVRSEGGSGSSGSSGSGGNAGGEDGGDAGGANGSASGSAGSSEAVVGLSDTETARERLSLPDKFGRMSWRELIKD